MQKNWSEEFEFDKNCLLNKRGFVGNRKSLGGDYRTPKENKPIKPYRNKKKLLNHKNRK